MEIRSYKVIMNEINHLGKPNGINIDDLLILSEELVNNLNIINEIGVNRIKIFNLHNLKNESINISKELNDYINNAEKILNLNEYYKNVQIQLSYTLQYQRNRKYNSLLPHKKSIYSNK